MSKFKPRKCVVTVKNKEIKGVIKNEFEEVGGPDDGAIFALIELDNGQTITVKMSETINE